MIIVRTIATHFGRSHGMSFGTNMYNNKMISIRPKIIKNANTVIVNESRLSVTVPAPSPVVRAETASKYESSKS